MAEALHFDFGTKRIQPPLGVNLVKVESAEQMKNAVLNVFDTADFVVKTAAVSDFRPADVLNHKRKKTGNAETITLSPTEDILAQLGKHKTKQILVGFCPGNRKRGRENPHGKLQRKNLIHCCQPGG